MLLRSAAVLATTIAVMGLAALLLPGADWTAAAWILPSLALTVASGSSKKVDFSEVLTY